jgi:release factor glutamine methyltransferase
MQVTIGTWLRESPIGQMESRILLIHALGLTRVQLITQTDRVLSVAEEIQLTALAQRRYNGEPIAYLVGVREFYGLAFEVTPDVLIPRPDTELLVELALQHLPPNGQVLDMGTGSGAIAIAIAHTRPDAKVTALDYSQAALAVAQRNAMLHGAQIHFLQSDWYSALALVNRQFDVIVSNPPYIVKDDSHLSQGDLRFEPIDALTDHSDGLSALRTITGGASAHLRAGGWLLMEHGYDQAAAVRDLLNAHDVAEVQSWQDLAGIERVSGGRL